MRIEMPLVHVLADMEAAGIAMNTEVLREQRLGRSCCSCCVGVGLSVCLSMGVERASSSCKALVCLSVYPSGCLSACDFPGVQLRSSGGKTPPPPRGGLLG
jgi:hypothetical protein